MTDTPLICVWCDEPITAQEEAVSMYGLQFHDINCYTAAVNYADFHTERSLFELRQQVRKLEHTFSDHADSYYQVVELITNRLAKVEEWLTRRVDPI